MEAHERSAWEARFYSYVVALSGYLLCFSALANCNNILAGGAILAQSCHLGYIGRT